MESESTSMTPARESLSFRRIVDVPFETWVAALGSWQRTARGGELRVGHLLLDTLTRSVPQHMPPAHARHIASRPHAPIGSGRP